MAPRSDISPTYGTLGMYLRFGTYLDIEDKINE
jgi:hypothetical protein